jgi:hypothetical protein
MNGTAPDWIRKKDVIVCVLVIFIADLHKKALNRGSLH